MVTAAARGGWRWYYESIADWMLRNPDKTQEDCAKFFNRSPNTISGIMRSDIFRAYMAQRRREWQREHDQILTQRIGQVALKAADNILDQLDKKRDTLRLDVLTNLMGSSLEALGFGKPSAPTVQVNTMVDSSTNTVTLPLSVSPAALEEARQALRLAETRRIVDLDALPALPGAGSTEAAPSLVSGDVARIEKDQE